MSYLPLEIRIQQFKPLFLYYSNFNVVSKTPVRPYSTKHLIFNLLQDYLYWVKLLLHILSMIKQTQPGWVQISTKNFVMQVNVSGFLSLDYYNSCFLELLLMMILWIQLLDNAEVENQENTPVLVAYSHFDIHAHDLIQSLKIGLMFKKQRESSFLLLANAILFFF